jgi:hypothetical protein
VELLSVIGLMGVEVVEDYAVNLMAIFLIIRAVKEHLTDISRWVV